MSLLGKLRSKCFHTLVEGHSGVEQEYNTYVNSHLDEHAKQPWKHWWMLFRLNWHYRIRKNSDFLIIKPASKKSGPYIEAPESTLLNRPEPFHFVKSLLPYDVISLDLFDTLVFRPFQNPTDLFNVVGKRMDYPTVFVGFKQGRIQAEKEARSELEKEYGTREINIFDIYDHLERKIGVDRKKGVETEIEVEKDYLFANPYMKIVFNILRAQGKTIVLTSDMYIPGNIMQELVAKCGYEGYEKIYVSCDYRCNKSSGDLFRIVQADYPGKKIVHVGDNVVGDIEGARKAGIDSKHYKNVKEAGKKYRPSWISELTASAYCGLVNAYLHNGTNKYPLFYEYGFVYGGIYILGFCNWLKQKAEEHKIDKLIFLSRDGDIYQKVFDKYFATIPTEYIYWSRHANIKYLIELNQDAFIERVIKQKATGALDVDLESIFNNFAIPLNEQDLKKYGLYKSTVLTPKNMPAVTLYLREHWDSICELYKEERLLVAENVKALLDGTRRIAVIDVGWTGSGPLGFRAFVKNYVSPDIETKCWMAGGTSNFGSSSSLLPFYMDDVVDTYLFSPLHNKRNGQVHENENKAINNNAVFEMFTQTQYPSYRGYTNSGSYEFDIPENENYGVISEIHKGILDFCELYYNTFSKDPYFLNISGFDAYRPFAHLALNKEYFELNFQNVIYGYGLSGDSKHQRIETIGERKKKMEERK